MNGYRDEGIPFRRISFYNKGYLVAMLLDHAIRSKTDDRHSLDDVMRRLYEDFGKKGCGYSEEAFWNIVEETASGNWGGFFESYVNGTESLEPALNILGERTGLILQQHPFSDPLLNRYGILLDSEFIQEKKISYIYPDSPAQRAGLFPNDIIVDHREDTLSIDRNGKRFSVEIHSNNYSLGMPQFAVSLEPSEAQLAAREAWRVVNSEF
jgi:predicted metalloprotease with PDZ domain